MQSTRISHKSQLKMIFVMLVNIQSWNWIKLIHSVMIIYCHDTCWYNSTTIFRVLYFLHKFNCFQWTTCCYVEQGSFKRFFSRSCCAHREMKFILNNEMLMEWLILKTNFISFTSIDAEIGSTKQNFFQNMRSTVEAIYSQMALCLPKAFNLAL